MLKPTDMICYRLIFAGAVFAPIEPGDTGPISCFASLQIFIHVLNLDNNKKQEKMHSEKKRQL